MLTIPIQVNAMSVTMVLMPHFRNAATVCVYVLLEIVSLFIASVKFVRSD